MCRGACLVYRMGKGLLYSCTERVSSLFCNQEDLFSICTFSGFMLCIILATVMCHHVIGLLL